MRINEHKYGRLIELLEDSVMHGINPNKIPQHS